MPTTTRLLGNLPIRPLTRREYDEMVSRGQFDGERVELLHGMIVSMSPQGTRHSKVIELLTYALIRLLPESVRVRTQCPFAAGETTQPEPDLMVVDDTPANRHPASAHLVVEVSDTSLADDRAVKAPIYAAAGVPEYWIVNLVDDVVEVHTGPADGRYGAVHTYAAGATIALTAFPAVQLDVEGVIPTRDE